MNRKASAAGAIALAIAVVLSASIVFGQSAAGTLGPYDVVVQQVYVTVRDGIKLATAIYRPARNGVPLTERLPVILHRTPYDKEAPATVEHAKFFAQHGYVSIVQDTRGKHASQGVFEKYYKYDAYDGYDTIEWAAQLPYSNGKIGMWGTSYDAHTQADASKLHPPHLATMVLNNGGMANAWDHSVRNDGAFEFGRQLSWAWEQALDTENPTIKKTFTTEKVADWYKTAPLEKGASPLAVAPNFEKYYFEEATISDYGPYWEGIGMQWEKYYGQTSDVPMLHIGGWYDIYLRGTIENYEKLSAMKKSAIRLLIGPWTHGGNARTYAGDVDFGPDAAITDFATNFHLKWFDHFLKGLPTGVENEAPVRIFVMGTGDGHKDANGRLEHGGYWRDASKWPLPETKFTPYYLHADGSLTTTAPTASESEKTTYIFDPTNPVPTIGGGVSARLKDGAFDQKGRPDLPWAHAPYIPLRERKDVVVYETDPLPADVAVIGPIQVKLWASSTGKDTDFTAKLVDVYPPSADYPQGYDMNLTDAIRRARYRDNSKTEKLMQPGTVYEFEINPYDTANVFKRGHRIRLDISSSNFPRFDVNPNTGEALELSKSQIAVQNSVYHSLTYQSFIDLPIMPEARN